MNLSGPSWNVVLLEGLQEMVQQDGTGGVNDSDLNDLVGVRDASRLRVQNHIPLRLPQDSPRPFDGLPLVLVVGMVGHHCVSEGSSVSFLGTPINPNHTTVPHPLTIGIPVSPAVFRERLKAGNSSARCTRSGRCSATHRRHAGRPRSSTCQSRPLAGSKAVRMPPRPQPVSTHTRCPRLSTSLSNWGVWPTIAVFPE